MTTTYYAPPENIDDRFIRLPADESYHAFKVLRKQIGDELVVVDGVGGWHKIQLVQVSKEACLGQRIESRQEVGEAPIRVRIGLALLKNTSRFEDFVEKAVELGVNEIVPLLTTRTEVKRFKPERLHRILVAAMKQCGRSRLPVLAQPQALKEVLANVPKSPEVLRLICHEKTATTASMYRVVSGCTASSIEVLVGPEGGFTNEEIVEAVSGGWQPVSLGKRRLRAETAAIVAATTALFFE